MSDYDITSSGLVKWTLSGPLRIEIDPQSGQSHIYYEAEAAAPAALDVATWTFRDPDGSGFCTRCLLPIAVHPLDEHGDDVDRCPDQLRRHKDMTRQPPPEPRTAAVALHWHADGLSLAVCQGCGMALEPAEAAPAAPGLDVEALRDSLLELLGEDDVLADGSLWKAGEIALNVAPIYARLLQGQRDE